MKWLKDPFYYIIFFAASSSLAGLALLSGFIAAPAVFEIRGPVSHDYIELARDDLPGQIEESQSGGRQWAIRRAVDDKNIFLQVLAARDSIDDALWLACDKPSTANEAYALPGVHKTFHAAAPRTLTPLLAIDGTVFPQIFGLMPHENAERLDVHGQPLRWKLADQILAGYAVYTRPKKSVLADKAKDEKIMAQANIGRPASAGQYRQLVERFAKRYNLSIELVYAIIHSESDFSPSLVSNKSAMGLMQILPGTASGEIHRFLYGKRGSVSFEDLRIPETNIHYGTAYLHILFNRYFQNVSNPVSREYCAIAAYNLGPNRFLRLYGANNSSAIEKLNEFSPEELYNDLVQRLPARETRFYLNKVKKMKNYYTAILGKGDAPSVP